MADIRKSLVVIIWKPSVEAAQRKVLLLKLIPERGGFWQSVTGKPEGEESFAEGALREAEEETGLNFDRIPQYLGLEYEFIGKFGPAIERAFYLPIVGGTEPPKVKVDPSEHTEYEWMDPAEAIQRVKFPGNRSAIERAAKGTPPLFLSKQGSFFQEGQEITHERTASLFHSSLRNLNNNHFTVKIGSDELDLIVEDCPRFVRHFNLESGEMLLSDGTKEKLDPSTLKIRGDNSMSAKLSNGWEARFLSPAYYELTKAVRENPSTGEFFLHLFGRDHKIQIPS